MGLKPVAHMGGGFAAGATAGGPVEKFEPRSRGLRGRRTRLDPRAILFKKMDCRIKSE